MRRDKVSAAMCLVVMLAATMTGMQAGRTMAVRPNIVLVLVDDLAVNLVAHMPQVRAMKERGLSFTNYFVSSSLCCPSRASILSGKHPHNSKVLGNGPPNGGFEAFRSGGAESMTLATALFNNGYRTGFMGKYLNQYKPVKEANGHIYIPPGWSEWYGVGNGYPEYNYNMAEPGRADPVFYGADPADYLTDVLSNKAVGFINRSAGSGQPFLLEVAPFAPHEIPGVSDPYDTLFPDLRAPVDAAFDEPDVSDKPAWAQRSPLTQVEKNQISARFRRRAQMMQSVDEMVGRIWHTLNARGVAGSTYLIFTSDNGYSLGEHRRIGKGTAYDYDIKVPFIVTGPGVPAGQNQTALTQNIDITPTFEELAGAVNRPFIRDGRSLVPFLRGQSVPDWRKNAYLEALYEPAGPSDPDHSSLAGAMPNYRGIRTATELYVEYVNGEREYYNLSADPYENHNRANVEAGPFARMSRLRDVIGSFANCAGFSCRDADAMQ